MNDVQPIRNAKPIVRVLSIDDAVIRRIESELGQRPSEMDVFYKAETDQSAAYVLVMHREGQAYQATIPATEVATVEHAAEEAYLTAARKVPTKKPLLDFAVTPAETGYGHGV